MAKSTNVIEGTFNLAQAAGFAGVSYPTILNWARRRDFPAFRSGRRWIIPRDSFLRWLDEQARNRATV